MGFSELITYLGDNPYFGAGAGLFGLGASTAILRRSYMIGAILFKRHYTSTLEVTSSDKSYTWLLKWINEKAATNTQHVSVETQFTQDQTGKILTKQEFMPKVGEHFFWYKNSLITCERSREKQSMNLHTGNPFESVTLTTLGRKRSLFNHMLNEAKKMVEEQQTTNTIMYTPMGSEWRVFGHPRIRRSVNSVVLQRGIKEEILSDVQEFLGSSQWYISRGIPYRRGYLLHGPPGCGKSSFITALACHLQMGVCVLSLNNRGLTDDRLNHLMAVAPENSIILLEDIDAAFPSRVESEAVRSAYDGLTPLTFSGLLNCLDGVASTEARIVFMTTNFIERLDPALIRPGRVDLIKEITLCTPDQIEQMYLRFYPLENSDDINSAEVVKNNEQLREEAISFASSVLEVRSKISAAEIQGYFLVFKHDRKAAFDNIHSLTTSFWKKND